MIVDQNIHRIAPGVCGRRACRDIDPVWSRRPIPHRVDMIDPAASQILPLALPPPHAQQVNRLTLELWNAEVIAEKSKGVALRRAVIGPEHG